MEVGFARRAKALLEEGGLDVEYHESDAAHHIDPAHVPAAIDWVGRTLVGTGAPRSGGPPDVCRDAVGSSVAA